MQPVDIHGQFETAFNSGNIDGLLALYEPDAVLCAEPGKHVQGAASIRETLGGLVGGPMKMTLKTVYCMVNGDMALLSGEWVLTGGPEPMKGKTSEVARRGADGRWRYVLDNPWSA